VNEIEKNEIVEESQEIVSRNETIQADGGGKLESDKITDEVVTQDAHSCIDEIKTNLSGITSAVQGIETSSSKIFSELRDVHKLVHGDYSNRLKSMQDELERFREQEKGRIFDSFLTELAKMYSDNINVIKEITDEKLQKRFKYMFEDLLQLMLNYGVEKQESEIGDKRNPKHCQVIERIITNDQIQHDTVAKSMNIGFFIENRTLVKEMIHVNVYQENKEETIKTSTDKGETDE